jgi:hypothetical protein
MVESLVDHRPLALAPRTTACCTTARPRLQPTSATALIAPRAMIVAPRTRFMPAATCRPRLVLRFVARIARLAAIFVVRTPPLAVTATSVGARFTAVRRRRRLRLRNEFGSLDGGGLFGAGRRDRIAQLRKYFLQHDKS